MSFIKPSAGDPFFQSSGPHRAFINHSPHLQGSVRHVRIGQQNETHRTKQPQIAQVLRKRKNSDVQLDNEPLDRRKKATQLPDVQTSDASSYGQWAQQQNFNKKKRELVLSTGAMETLIDRYKNEGLVLQDITPSRMFQRYVEFNGLQKNFRATGVVNQPILRVTFRRGNSLVAGEEGIVLLISDDKIDNIASYYTDNQPPTVNVAAPVVNMPPPVVNIPPYPPYQLPALPPMPNIYLDGRQVRHINPLDQQAPMDFGNPPPEFWDRRREARSTFDSLPTPVSTYRIDTPNNQSFANRLNTTIRTLRNSDLFRRMSGRQSAASAPRFNPYDDSIEMTDLAPRRPSETSTVPMDDTAGAPELDEREAEDDVDLSLNQATVRWYRFKTFSTIERARLAFAKTLYMTGNRLFLNKPRPGERIFIGEVLKENPQPGTNFPVIDVDEDGELFRFVNGNYEPYDVGNVNDGIIVLDYMDDNFLFAGKGFKSRGGAFKGATFLLKDKVSEKYVYEITFES